MLKMSILNIRRNMKFNYDIYENLFETNCYAFALGLDLAEDEICPNAYDIGTIAANVFNIPLKNVYSLSNEERLLLDLKALKLGYRIVDKQMESTSTYLDNYWCRSWDLLLFNDAFDNDFHFARIDFDGKMYHKIGRTFMEPSETTIEDIEKMGYTFARRYRLKLWKSIND